MGKVTAALYARASPGNPALDTQVETLTRYCAARGWAIRSLAADDPRAAVSFTFADDRQSGARDSRPAFDAMMAAVRAREVSAVVVTRLDRLARSVRHLLHLAEEFRALGVELVATEQQIDTSTPAGRLMFTMLGAFAEFERDLIRERVIGGLRRAQERGTRSGKPIGRPRRVVNLAEVRQRRGRGQTWRAIARALKVPVRTLRRASLRRA